MAGRKPTANRFGLLDTSDPGDKRLSDLDTAKSTSTPALSLTHELFGNAYPSVRDYIIRQSQLAMAKRHAAGPAIQADGAKGGPGPANNGSSQQQPGMSGGYKSYNNTGTSRRQQKNKALAEGMEAPPPPPPPPSLYDISEFPSLK